MTLRQPSGEDLLDLDDGLQSIDVEHDGDVLIGEELPHLLVGLAEDAAGRCVARARAIVGTCDHLTGTTLAR